MDLQEFIKNFAEQFEDTDFSMFAPETSFRDLDEWSSIMGLSIILMVDEQYGITLTASDIQAATTIADLFYIVSAKA